MHWMCVLYEGEPTAAGTGCGGPGRWGRLPGDPCTDAAHCWAWPHRRCRTGAHRGTCCCDEALRAGVAA